VGAFGIAARCNATSSSSSSAVSEAAGVHELPRTEPVVSAEWLHANLKDPDVKVRFFFSAVSTQYSVPDRDDLQLACELFVAQLVTCNSRGES
jgi:hypothetical protein